MNYCDRILKFGPGMMLGQNSSVFIVFGTATPSVKNTGFSEKLLYTLCYICGRLNFTPSNGFTIL